MKPIVIIGGGMAAYTLAREVRKLDSLVPLTLIMADEGAFYSKPMLSNAFAQKKTVEALLMSPAGKMAADLNADIRPHSWVTALDREARTISIEGPDGKTELAWDQLVLALGADPIRLPLAGDGVREVLSVNDLADYARFRAALGGKKRIAILGGGLIGCEFANDLAGAGFQPTVFDLAPQPLGRLLPSKAGQHFAARLGLAGIAWRFGTTVQVVEREGAGFRLNYGADHVESVDLVLSAVGLKPRIGLAQSAGLVVNRGIVTDRLLRTSDPAIHALGDCAEVEGQVLPFIMPIMQAARALATTLTGTEKPVSYPAMPVVVKTPACPTVVSPPAPGAAGRWVETPSAAGVRAIFEDESGKPLGFALLGDAVAEKQALTTKVPPVLA